MDTYWMDPEWREQLEQGEMGSLVSLLMRTEGQCLSMHSRGSTFRCTLPSGQVVYVKRDHYTMKKDIFAQIRSFQKPLPKCIREWEVCNRLREMGFQAPVMIAGGYRTSLCLPTVAGTVMLPVEGEPLEDFLKRDVDEIQKIQAISSCEALLATMQRQGCDWPDCKPEHFLLQSTGKIGIIDVERLVFRHSPLSRKRCSRQLAHFRSRLPENMKEYLKPLE